MLKSSKGDETNINGFLGQATNFNGSLVFDGLLRIDGTFEGNIKTADTLMMKAEIEAGVVKISGNFEGNIVAKTKVELLKNSVVLGTITTPCISMEDGVTFNGSCVMPGKNVSKEEKI